MYDRIFLIVLDSLGVGATADAVKYGDEGVNTLGHIIEKGNYNLNVLEKLGFLNLVGVNKERTIGYRTIMKPKNLAKDTLNGHYEMMGLIEEKPFQTLNEALTIAKPNSIINILSGTYPITNQIILNIPGLVIKGRAGTTILLEAPIIPFLCSSNDITIDNLTITSNIPYPNEFIQIAGNNNQILNCKIYGPPQSGDSSTWIVNRGFVTQNNISNLLVRNNIFYNLRQPAYLNPNSTGNIMENVVYNTRGFVVDQAIFVFSGNSWGIPQNAIDIALLTGTKTGDPYDPVTVLSINNSNATISDQR